MTFTTDGYMGLLSLLKEKSYKATDYFGWEEYEKCVILRHDVDFDLQQALFMAQAEHMQGIKSTYFVLLTSNFYNIHSCRNRSIVKEIQDMGHTVGLHFDEAAYPEDAGNVDKIVQDIKKELCILSAFLETDITVFSHHRPTKAILDADIEIQGAVNSYGNIFFRKFKYLSDSRMHWREPVSDIICTGACSRLHILTHPFWYRGKEMGRKEILYGFLSRAGMERYRDLDDNFTDLKEVIEWEGDRI